MKDLFAFLKSKTFLFNLIAAIVIVIIGLFAIGSWMDSYTDHGEKIEVPKLINLELSEVDSVLTVADLRGIIIDSIYDENATISRIVKQDPEPFQPVKSGRKIYLTITSRTAPQVSAPDLVNLSLRQANSTLEVIGFRIDSVEYRADICSGCVLEQRYRGEVLKPGTPLRKGSTISLVVGKGMSSEQISMPYLVGLELNDAIRNLIDKSLNIGSVVFEGCNTKSDSDKAQVYKQHPIFYPGARVQLGSSIDLFFTSDVSSIEVMSQDEINRLDSIANSKKETDADGFDDMFDE